MAQMTWHRSKPDRSTAGEAAPVPDRWRTSIRRALVFVVTAASIYGVVLVAGALFYRRLLYPAPNEFPSQVRTAVGGAQVTRTISTRGGAGMDLDYVRRAAIPSALRYDRGQGQLAFTTAGPIHGLLFVFKVGPNGLEGSWFSSRVPGTDDYRWTGNDATAQRCGAGGGAAPLR
jgi:hypothetical protein